MPEQHRFTNRLAKEKSPYLLQHAHNPVDWYPWSEEAFQLAKEQDKPVFLSIGYATCHWCHVMERESFENEEIAALMNQNFINIKVDREELPEVDNLYMEFAQSMMAGAAGWPLNVILTPSLEPFFAATYLPPNNRHGLVGLQDLIQRIKELWTGEEREKVIGQAGRIVEVFTDSIHSVGEDLPDEEIIIETVELLYKMADPVYGGIKGTPKFPIAYQLSFLMAYFYLSQDGRALFLADRSLEMMHRGGIYDHLGGGFSRYTTDEKWLIPHFEKMLYDNAILTTAYTEGYQLTKRPLYKTVTEEILTYILRDMTHPEGGFYSAEDSETEGHEGRFYTWTFEEIESLLGPTDANLFCEFYDVTQEGNFDGRTILNTPFSLEEFADKKGLRIDDLSHTFAQQRQILWKAREQRPHPFKDDKVITSWNGMMIHSLTKASCALRNPTFLQAAQKGAFFIRHHLWQDGHLKRRWRNGEALYHGGLDDYAYMIRACLSLFEVDGNPEWLLWALEMTQVLEIEFKVEEGAFYQTDGEDENLIIRKCQYSDGAEPSGNAIHTENLLRLYQITNNSSFFEQAEDVLSAVETFIENYSPGYIYHIQNLQRYYDQKAPTFLIALNEKEENREELFDLLNSPYMPHKVIVWRRPQDAKLLQSVIPAFEQQIPQDNKTTLYICHEGVCEKPLTDLNEIRQRLQNKMSLFR